MLVSHPARCSSPTFVFGEGMGTGRLDEGTVKGLHLVVDDIDAARAELIGRGASVSDVQDLGGVKYAYFEDPDGNSWALQQISRRQLP